MVERPLMMRWVVGSIPLVGSIKLFLDPAGVTTAVTKVVVCAVLSLGEC